MRISYNKEENAFIIDADNTVIINDGNRIGLELCDLINPHGVALQWSQGSILSSKEAYISDEFRKMPLGEIFRALFIRIFYKRKPSFKIPEKETIGLYIHPPVIPNTAKQNQNQ